MRETRGKITKGVCRESRGPGKGSEEGFGEGLPKS